MVRKIIHRKTTTQQPEWEAGRWTERTRRSTDGEGEEESKSVGWRVSGIFKRTSYIGRLFQLSRVQNLTGHWHTTTPAVLPALTHSSTPHTSLRAGPPLAATFSLGVVEMQRSTFQAPLNRFMWQNFRTWTRNLAHTFLLKFSVLTDFFDWFI